MTVAIVDYGAGNVQSLCFALQRLGVEPVVSHDEETLRTADRVIFPGVGQAVSALQQLRACGLDVLLPQLRQPVLGICLGLQLLCRSTEEGGATACLGVFPLDVVRFPAGEKVPHTGWNEVSFADNKLFAGMRRAEYLYFVHSYRALQGEHTVATAQYAGQFSAALQRDNFFAVQFHPEKSSAVGAHILRNFLELSR